MGRRSLICLVTVVACAIPTGISHAADRPGVGSEAMAQAGTYASLTQPDFTGLVRIADVLTDETLGLGTFDNLDGELVLVGGVAYQVRPDGTPRVADRRQRTPFLQAVRFRPERSGPVPPGTTCAQLPSLIDALVGSSTGVVAVRVRGTFDDLVARSVTAVPPPFAPLADVIANQTVFPLPGARAVLVGFRQGAGAVGIGQPGLHLHGITADRGAGGHVLSCTVGDDVELSVQRVRRIDVAMPPVNPR